MLIRLEAVGKAKHLAIKTIELINNLDKDSSRW